MPRRLNRPRYGHSYTWGREQRVPSEEYKENFDKIQWKDRDLSDCDTRKTRFGKARVIRFP
jgi:hypothetical protein